MTEQSSFNEMATSRELTVASLGELPVAAWNEDNPSSSSQTIENSDPTGSICDHTKNPCDTPDPKEC